MTDLYGGNVVKVHLGRLVLKKLAGAGPMAVGAQVVIPHASAFPRNPRNNSYLTGVNSAGAVSGDVPGKRTPSITITTVIKTASFFTAALLNSLILATDASGDTDTWAILLDDKYAPAVYDGAKFAGVRVQQNAQGGPMALTLAALAMYGDNENPGTLFTPTTFSSTSTDAGQATDVSKISYGGTADLVSALDLNFVRPQGYVPYDDGTLFMSGITSGIFAGTATISQSVKYGTSWGSSGTVNIGATGAGVAISLLQKLDEDVSDFMIGTRTKVRAYSFYDSSTGGMPVAAAAL